jgi:L-ascorbate metabolism protein UlaG (beta-lactamase superfamily)
MSESDPPTLRWLGQAGYEIRSRGGQVLLLDAYLSHNVEDELGQVRAVEPPVSPEDAHADVVLATHWHPDHLDPDLCRSLRDSSRCAFVGPTSNTSRLAGWGVPTDRIRELDRGHTLDLGDFRLTAGYARHDVRGWLVEDAISVVVEVDGLKVFHSGDTEYDSRVLPIAERGPFDVAMFVINGSGGCMNAREAALMAHQLHPSVAIPMHYGLWAEGGYGRGATLDPQEFADYCERLGGPPTVVLSHGATLELT